MRLLRTKRCNTCDLAWPCKRLWSDFCPDGLMFISLHRVASGSRKKKTQGSVGDLIDVQYQRINRVSSCIYAVSSHTRHSGTRVNSDYSDVLANKHSAHACRDQWEEIIWLSTPWQGSIDTHRQGYDLYLHNLYCWVVIRCGEIAAACGAGTSRAACRRKSTWVWSLKPGIFSMNRIFQPHFGREFCFFQYIVHP